MADEQWIASTVATISVRGGYWLPIGYIDSIESATPLRVAFRKLRDAGQIRVLETRGGAELWGGCW